MIRTVFFDLDGTLLPMDQDVFVKAYFGGIAKRLAPYGYEAKALIDAIWRGTGAMGKNDGTRRNEEAFWQTFCALFGERALEDIPHFDAFYREDFDSVAAVCGHDVRARAVLDLLHEKKIPAVLATNPIFPAIATEKRIAWAGLSPDDFVLYTTYENCSYCKPNLAYYRDLLDRIDARPEECLMVGNDVQEDMITEQLGMKVFLLTDCIINKENKDISAYPHGGFKELKQFIEADL